MSWFVVFLASVFIVSMSGYDERLLVCKGVFLGGGLLAVWRCTWSGFFLPHIKGEDVLAPIHTQTSVHYL